VSIDFVKGLATVDGKLVILLNVDHLLQPKDLAMTS
jgi:hypothetical protein